MTTFRCQPVQVDSLSTRFIFAVAAGLVAVGLMGLYPRQAAAVAIDWVTVGDPGNSADSTGYGAVADSFRVMKYEVTIQQYTDFLNAAARSDPYSLYNPSMGTNLNVAGISRSGSDGSYTYSVMTNGGYSGNRPITHVSWWDAARFSNWMQNGQGSGSTETGAYTLNGATSGTAPAVNPGAQFSIPTENQWYKAAYYSPLVNSGSGGYSTFATQSNTDPGNTIGNGTNQANYAAGFVYSVTQSSTFSFDQNYLTDVGAFTNSPSAYGTFDQSGNVFEWNDLSGVADSSRGQRGGGWGTPFGFALSSSSRYTIDPASENVDVGFRLVSPVSGPAPIPEIDPSGLRLVAALLVGSLALHERRRHSR
jgi:formylglycine-generating enzyme required for sulfatase activity